jgi:hypothetical protein
MTTISPRRHEAHESLQGALTAPIEIAPAIENFPSPIPMGEGKGEGNFVFWASVSSIDFTE